MVKSWFYFFIFSGIFLIPIYKIFRLEEQYILREIKKLNPGSAKFRSIIISTIGGFIIGTLLLLSFRGMPLFINNFYEIDIGSFLVVVLIFSIVHTFSSPNIFYPKLLDIIIPSIIIAIFMTIVAFGLIRGFSDITTKTWLMINLICSFILGIFYWLKGL